MAGRWNRGRSDGDSDPCTRDSRLREREYNTEDLKGYDEGDGTVDGNVVRGVLIDLMTTSLKGDVERQGDQECRVVDVNFGGAGIVISVPGFWN